MVQAAEQPVVLPPVPSAGVPSVMSQSAPGLLFDPSIIGNVQVVTPVGMVLKLTFLRLIFFDKI